MFKVDEDNNLVINMEKKAENHEKKHHGRYLRREDSYSTNLTRKPRLVGSSMTGSSTGSSSTVQAANIAAARTARPIHLQNAFIISSPPDTLCS